MNNPQFKSGFVAVIGRPNVGKSTFLNKILKQKIAITSNKVQTTRKSIKGIYTNEKGQIIFIDTPGIHKAYNQLGHFLAEETSHSIGDADVIVFVADGSVPSGPGDLTILENIRDQNHQLIMLVNKTDLLETKNQENIQTIKQSYQTLADQYKVKIFYTSALKEKSLEMLTDEIISKLPQGPMYYTEDIVTDESIRSLAEELIREKILHMTKDEIPHSVAVQVEIFKDKGTITHIKATIYVERDSQKSIVIGEKGQMIKQIGITARKDIEELVEMPVYLDLYVKVKKNWRKDQNALKQFGYKR